MTNSVSDLVHEKHLLFLDGLRESGVADIFEAVSRLERAFKDLTHDDAQTIAGYWGLSYSARHPPTSQLGTA